MKIIEKAIRAYLIGSLALAAACSKIEVSFPFSKPPEPTATMTSTPVPTPTSTPEPYSYDFLNANQIAEFEALDLNQKKTINYIAFLQDQYGFPLLNNSIESILALGESLMALPVDLQLDILDSPLSPLELDAAKVYNFGFYGIPADELALTEDIFQRLGFDVFTLDWTGEPVQNEDEYDIEFLVQSRVDKYMENRENPDITSLAEMDIDQISQLIQNEFPRYIRMVHNDPTMQSDMPDFDTIMQSIIDSHPAQSPFIGVYNVHMNLREQSLAISSFTDLKNIPEIIPHALLDKLDAPYIAIINTCPKDWPERVNAYLEEYNLQRTTNGREALPYLVFFGNTQLETETLDPYRLAPLGDLFEALFISIYQSEMQGFPFLNNPVTSFTNWNNIIANPNADTEFLTIMQNGLGHIIRLQGAYMMTPEGKQWVATEFEENFSTKSPAPNVNAYNNISLKSIIYVSNIDSNIVENFLFADIVN